MNTLELLFGNEYSKAISESNVFVVGVGGIGCELLKCLARSGYKNITILDYDHVEMTNLNRQFYFRSHHAKNKQSKAEVGKQEILKLNPNLNITAIHASIFEPRFDVLFYRSFTVVFCALDNIPARQHLGKMCIIAGCKMVDAGTGGFNGQVSTQIRFKTQCNNCEQRKITENTNFAICTIRATPTEPIHVITYGMSLFKLLFGPLDSDNHLIDLIKAEQFTSYSSHEEISAKAIELFNILFYQYIKDRKDQVASDCVCFPLKYDEALLINEVYQRVDPKILRAPDDQQQPLSFHAKLFVESFSRLVGSGQVGKLIFEKDDQDCMNFVASVTNIRTYNFTKNFKPEYQDHRMDKLKYMSIKKIKEIAGKIIPAIASTNAIAAAVQISESNKELFTNKEEKLHRIFIHNFHDKLETCRPSKPSLGCQVCSIKNIYIFVQTDMNTTTLEKLITYFDPWRITHRQHQFYQKQSNKKPRQFYPINNLIQQCGYPPNSCFIFTCIWRDGERYESWIKNPHIHVVITHKLGVNFLIEEDFFKEKIIDQIKIYRQKVQKDKIEKQKCLESRFESDYFLNYLKPQDSFGWLSHPPTFT